MKFNKSRHSFTSDTKILSYLKYLPIIQLLSVFAVKQERVFMVLWMLLWGMLNSSLNNK